MHAPGSPESDSAGRSPSPNQRRHVMVIVALASLPLVVLAAFGIVQGKVLAEGRVAEERVALAQAGALTASAFVQGNLSTARSLSRIRALMAAEPGPGQSATYDAILAENPDWVGWGLADRDGWNIVSTGAAPRTLFVGDRPYFQEAMRTGQAVVSPPVLNRRTGQPTVVLAVPVELDNRERGAIVVSLSTARLASELQGLRQESGIRISLVDAEGTRIAGPEAASAGELPSLRGRTGVDAALRGDVGSMVAEGENGEETLVAFAPVPAVGWGVVVSQPTAVAFDVANRQTTLGIGILALALILASVIARHLGGRLADLYARQRSATARAEATARTLERVIASAPVAIAILRGPNYRHETVNARYQALRPDVPMLGRDIASVFPPAPSQAMRALFDHVFASGQQAVAADQQWHLDDRADGPITRYLTQIVARLDDEDGAPDAILSMLLDTTELVLARQRVERAKDELLSTASHELKTPLTSLGLAAQLIERMVERGTIDEARLARQIGTIRNQVERLTRLIASLLDISRIETGRLALDWEPVDLVQLARLAVVRERDTLPEDAGHEIVLRAEDGSLVAEGDEARLEQVIANLLSNAVKYSPDGGIVEVVVRRDGELAVLEVVDRGIGVPESEREHLFAPFSRAPSAVGSGIEGTGLGLYISRRIVEAHGGTIEMRDTPGGGATFRVTLPLRRSPGSSTRSTDAA